jgi:LemA protein
MKRSSWIILGVIAIIAIVLGSRYNAMVKMNQQVASQWSQVENVYQRRLDLIPNLVNTVKGYADFEKSTLTQVIEARANATKVNINPGNLTPEALQQFQEAQGELSSALSRLMVVVERYPDLKANQNFLELQSQLEGTENRITVERMKFNEVVQSYNSAILSFPNNLMAGMFGFKEKAYFKSASGAEKAPEVKF